MTYNLMDKNNSSSQDKAVNLIFDNGENIVIKSSEPGVNIETYEKISKADPIHFVVAQCSTIDG